MKELLLKLLDFWGLAYWVEIVTELPQCTYYFGPFLNKQEAQLAQDGYLEDLQSEEAQGIKIALKQCKPDNLTIFDEIEDLKRFNAISNNLNNQTFHYFVR